MIPTPPPLKKPALLIVIDGFGVAPDGEGNCIRRADTPQFDRLIRLYPTMTLKASGEEVGLSWGEMGNSEVGHLSIGAGRVYYQTLPRINRDIAAGDFARNRAFLDAIEHVKQTKGRLQLIGMVSKGGVHSLDEHAVALLQLAKQEGVNEVFVHAILDGRDTIYNAGVDFIQSLEQHMTELGIGTIATMSGRYYAMDRDNRWDRIEKAYNAMVKGEGETASSAMEALKASYTKEVYDEQFVPTVIRAEGCVKAGDAVILFNFRPDRMRELAKAFSLPTFDAFARPSIDQLFVSTMTEYEKGLPVEVAYPPEVIDQCLAQVISEHGMRQLHIAETEKYAHVTFFLNGTREEPFAGEDRVIVPSPKVASYDLAPEMSAFELTDRVLKALTENVYDFIAMNFANPDMVGHTGNFAATIKAVETVDTCLGKLVEAVLSRDGVVFLTADHGNAEERKNLRTGDINKEHATNPVPFLIIAKRFEGQPSIAGEVPDGDLSLMPPVGMLADVAPTILMVLGIEQPPEMTGQPLM